MACSHTSGIGCKLESLRKEVGISKEELCDGICTTRNYYRILNSEVCPSDYVLHGFSEKLNFDFYAFYRLLNANSQSEEFYNLRRDLSQLSSARLYDQLIKRIEKARNWLKKLENEGKFDNEGKRCILYYEALYYISRKDYDTAETKCLELLKTENPAISPEHPCKGIFSEYSYYAAGLIANISFYRHNAESVNIYKELLKKLRSLQDNNISYYQNNTFYKNFHQSVSYNTAISLIQESRYNEADEFLTSACKFAIEYETMHLLPSIWETKVIVYYNLNDTDRALKALNTARVLFEIHGWESYWEQHVKTLHEKCEGLFD